MRGSKPTPERRRRPPHRVRTTPRETRAAARRCTRRGSTRAPGGSSRRPRTRRSRYGSRSRHEARSLLVHWRRRRSSRAEMCKPGANATDGIMSTQDVRRKREFPDGRPPRARWSRGAAGAHRRTARHAGGDRAEVFLRRAGVRAVRRDLRAARVLPDAHRARDLRAHRDDIVARDRPGKQLVDLGAGDCAKAACLAAVRCAPRATSPSTSPATRSRPRSRGWRRISGTSTMRGVVTDFTHGLDLVGRPRRARPSTFFYPGSSIGNFAPRRRRRSCADSRCIARRARQRAADRRRHAQGPARLEAAYDDALGVTAAFNRNVLRHVNRVLGATSIRRRSTHRARLRRGTQGASRCTSQRATTSGDARRRERAFAAGERIHTENSYKYAPDDFERAAARGGFADVRCGRMRRATSRCSTRQP